MYQIKKYFKLNIPSLTLSYVSGLNNRRVNINEHFAVTGILPAGSNPELVSFTSQVVYDFNTYGIVKFNYQTMGVTIWDFFTDFAGLL